MKQRLILVLVIIFSFANLKVFAQSQFWKTSQPTNVNSLWDVVMLDSQNGVAVTWEEKVANGVKTSSAKIISTFDGGKTWQETLSEVNRGAPAIDKLDDKNVVVVGGANNYLSCWKSNNGINSFTSVMSDNAYVQGKPSFWSVDFVNSSIGYGGTASGYILKTTNGGNTWNYLSHNFGKGCIVTMSFLDEKNGFVAHSNADYDQYRGKDLYKTTDAGITWKKVLSVDVIREVLYHDDKTVFCVGSVGSQPKIWKSNDAGLTWKVVFESNPEVYWMNGISFTKNKYIGYAVGGQGDSGNGAIFRTIDGGESWEMEIGNLPSDLVKVSFDEETNGIAVGENGVVYYCERTAEPAFVPELKTTDTILDLSFGEIGDTISAKFSLKAKNPAGITINEIISGEADFAKKGFSLDLMSNKLPVNLAVGENFEFKIKLVNTKANIYESFVRIKSNDSKFPDKLIKVIGEVVLPNEPTISTSMLQLNYVDVPINTKKDIKFKVHSATPSGLEVKSIKIESDPDKQFAIKTSETLPYEMFDVDSFEVTISYTPKITKDFSTNLIINSNDTKAPSLKIPINISNSNSNTKPLTLSADTLKFGDVTNTSLMLPLTLKCIKDNGITIETISISNNEDSLFKVNLAKTLPYIIINKDSMLIEVAINKLKYGKFERNLTFTTNDATYKTYTVPIQANIISTSIGEEDLMKDITFLSINNLNAINVGFNALIPQSYNLYLFDLSGKELTIQNGVLHPGKNVINAGNLSISDGVYIIVLETNNGIVSKKYNHPNK